MKGQAREAEPLLREAVEIRKKNLAKDHWITAQDESYLGGCLTVLGRYAEAEPLLLRGYEKMKATTMAPTRRVRQGLDRVIQLYEAWNKPEEAKKWRAKLDKNEALPKQ